MSSCFFVLMPSIFSCSMLMLCVRCVAGAVALGRGGGEGGGEGLREGCDGAWFGGGDEDDAGGEGTGVEGGREGHDGQAHVFV